MSDKVIVWSNFLYFTVIHNQIYRHIMVGRQNTYVHLQTLAVQDWPMSMAIKLAKRSQLAKRNTALQVLEVVVLSLWWKVKTALFWPYSTWSARVWGEE